jgi:stage IV sporulation protein FB
VPDSACLPRWLGNGRSVQWSVRIARVAGIEVKLHFTFILLLGLYAWMFYLDSGEQVVNGTRTFDVQAGLQGAGQGVIFMLLLFFCVLLHEFGHAFAARAFGIRTPDITLLPIGGLARLEKIPSSPWQELVIAVAGPAVNVVIAGGLFLALGGSHGADLLTLDAGAGLWAPLLTVNLFLVAFNAIPAFPMDGGRVLRALLATRLRYGLATLIAARVGQGMAGLFVVAYFLGWGSPMLLFIAFFVFLGAQQELLYAQMREAARSHRVGEFLDAEYHAIDAGLEPAAVRDVLVGASQDLFPIVDADLRFLRLARREELVAFARGDGGNLSDLGQSVETLQTDTNLEVALEAMQKAREPVLPVVNASGQVVGLIDIDRLVELARTGRGSGKS